MARYRVVLQACEDVHHMPINLYGFSALVDVYGVRDNLYRKTQNLLIKVPFGITLNFKKH